MSALLRLSQLAYNLHQLEKVAKKYASLKAAGRKEELPELMAKIIDSITSPDFQVKTKDQVLAADGSTTYLYDGGETFPFLFDFLAEILHSKVPIEIEDVKFGPGEILVTQEGRPQADARSAVAFKELQKLIHGKRERALSKFT